MSIPPSTRTVPCSTPAAATRCPSHAPRKTWSTTCTHCSPRRLPGPYVLVGHSSGGLVARLYASEYPDDVVGMVLLDSTHEDVWLRFQEALTPEQWAVFEAHSP